MPTLRVPQDFATIGQAVAAAAAGDTILVDPAYGASESVTVGVNNLTISASASTPLITVTLLASAVNFTATGTNDTEVYASTSLAINNTIHGNDGDNFIRGGAGDDTIDGGAGFDWADFRFSAAPVTVTLTDVVAGHSGGTATGDGADTLIDIERVRGSTAADTLTGNAEDNWFRGGTGDDVIDGKGGFDWVDYRNASNSVTVTLTDGAGGHTGGSSSGADGADTLTDIEAIRGGDFADTLTGNSQNNWLRGRAGDDILDGKGGDDTADYGNAGGSVTVTLTNMVAGHTGGSSSGADGADTLIDIESVAGGDFADSLTGNAEDNWLRGRGGDDTLDGGDGFDTADYSAASGSVTVTLTNMVAGHTGGSSSGADGADTLIDIEEVRGSDFVDVLTGNDEDNFLRGNNGDDFLNGAGGFDWASYGAATGAVTVTLTDAVAGHTGGSSTGADGADTLTDIEGLTGSAFGDTLTGNSADNWLRGNAGADTVDGKGGEDWADYKFATAAVTVTLTNAVGGHTGGSSSGADGADTLIDIENVRGGDFNDALTGNSADNKLRGGLGNDTINGGAGFDFASYRNATGAVTVTLTNVVAGHSGGSSSGADGADTLIDVEGLVGSDFDDVLTGNSSANILGGRLGADTLNGGAGLDTAEYRYAEAGVVATLTDAVGGHTGGSSSGAEGVDTLIDIENLIGSEFADTLVGNSAVNVLTGRDGADWLDGKGGRDTMIGGLGDDTYVVDLSIDIVAELANEGVDTVEASVAYTLAANVEKLILTGAAAIGGAGNDLANEITGNGAANAIAGGGGGDTIRGGLGNDNLDGGAGDDFLYGEAGNDGFRAGTGADLFDGGADIDAVNYSTATSAVVYLDGSGVNAAGAAGDVLVGIENLVGSATGTDIFVGDANANRLTGNGGNDRLTGRAGADILEGGDGNDRLVGEEGADVMTGGAGIDTFVFNLAPNAGGFDRITDFEAGIDKLEIDASLFGGGLVAGGAVSLVSGSAPTSAGFASGVFHYDTDDGFLYWDADGQGAGARISIVRLQNLPTLTTGDFTVVA
jgi:Ca2+-binding RTX toxin-like protein